MLAAVERMERFQVPLALGAIGVGALIGLQWPATAGFAETMILPVLGALLYVTFLGVPFRRLGRALRDVRFLLTVLAVNFLIAPLVVWALSRIVAHDRVLLVGVLFVLLTPCIDYVIVFTGLAGGAQERLLAVSPLLLIAQMAALPLYLWWFLGPEFVMTVEPAPFVHAFLLLIALPLGGALLTQLIGARMRLGSLLIGTVTASMVPLMMLTLGLVVASQIAGVTASLGALLPVIPVHLLFAIIMVAIGILTSALARLDVPARRAVAFSGATRNSLVVLPLVLALPEGFELAPLVVVTQTLIELIAMVILVRLMPRLIPSAPLAAQPVGRGSRSTGSR